MALFSGFQTRLMTLRSSVQPRLMTLRSSVQTRLGAATGYLTRSAPGSPVGCGVYALLGPGIK